MLNNNNILTYVNGIIPVFIRQDFLKWSILLEWQKENYLLPEIGSTYKNKIVLSPQKADLDNKVSRVLFPRDRLLRKLISGATDFMVQERRKAKR